MKKLLLFTGFFICSTVGYSQSLHKVQEVKGNTSEKIALNIPKQSVPASSLSESFESTTFPPTGWTTFTFSGSGWSRETVGTPLPLWGESEITTPPGGGNAVAYCTFSFDSSFNDQWLITPLIGDVRSEDTLYFWMRNQIYDYSDTVYIYYTTDGTEFNLIGRVSYPELGDTNWGKWYLPLGQYITSGSSVYIGFQEFLYDNQTNGGAICLDLVEIKGTETANAPTVTTNSASNVTSNSATLNGTVNPNNSSTTVTFEYGTSASYGNEIPATPSPIDGNLGIGVSADLSGLQPNTTYHYRVRATNSVGVSGGTDVTFTTSSVSAPSASTGSATNISTNSATLNGTVNPNGMTTAVSFQYGTTTAYGNQLGADQSPVSDSSNVSVSTNISGLQANTLYHFRVVAIGGGTTANGSDATFTTSQTTTYPSTINLNNSFTFNALTQSSSYRMLGLPGNNNLPPTQFISGTQKTDWNMFYDNGATDNYFEEYNGSTTFNFTPGKGFWVLSRNAINVNTQVNTVTLAGDNTYSVTIHSGWNIISNPFEKNVSLADIQNANGLAANAIIYAFNGNFSQPTTMSPYEGYYFNNVTGLNSLKIPYPFTTGTQKISEPFYPFSEKNFTLKLNTEEFSSKVIIGFDQSASYDFDDMDYFAPPGDFEEVRINLINNKLSTSYKQLFTEHRPQVGEGQKFDLLIKNATNKKADLLAEGVEKFTEYEIYLVDERLKKFYDLKTANKIEIKGNHQSNEFSLLIGNRNFINTYKENSTPTEFALYQNYPNPFNPSTFIRYQVPEKMHISIKVFDVLGDLIKTLVDEVKNEGYYEAVWDASNQTSGVYFYQIKTESFTETKKMILLR
jgi:hypothetical protein